MHKNYKMPNNLFYEFINPLFTIVQNITSYPENWNILV